MISAVFYENSFKKDFKRLPVAIKKKFQWALEIVVCEKSHNSLRHKKVKGMDGMWEFSITMNYRCLYFRDHDEIYLIAIGTHEDVF